MASKRNPEKTDELIADFFTGEKTKAKATDGKIAVTDRKGNEVATINNPGALKK